MVILIPLLFGSIIGITEYISKRIDIAHKSYTGKIASFSAGVSITYLLLELLPLFTEAAFSISKLLFLSLLGGFIIHHLIEKEIYQHNRSHQLIRKLSSEEQIFYYFYHVILGIVLVTFLRQDFRTGTLFFVSIVSYTVLSNLTADPHNFHWKATILSTSTPLGVVFALLFWKIIPLWVDYMLVGIAAGVLLFTITRHHIPFGRKGSVGYFSLGTIIYTTLIVASWWL